MTLKLVIADKNYSSWSMRPWIAMTAAGIEFEEIFFNFNMPGWKAAIREYSPAGKVPILTDGEVTVWESLAILDYLHERFPETGIWPDDWAARAHARSISSEMATGFTGLRGHYPMNIRRSVPDRAPSEAAAADIARVTAIWRHARETYGTGGDFLFGAKFCGADAMYAPVVSRFTTYAVEVGEVEQAYMAAVRETPAFKAWQAEALKEPWIVDEDEV